MRLNANNSTKATSTDDEPTNSDDHEISLQELVATTFSTLEDNINEIIAFEEEAQQKQHGFDRRRKLFESPSERYVAESLQSTPNTARTPANRLSFSSDSSWMKSLKEDGDDDAGIQSMKPSSFQRRSSGNIPSLPSSEKMKGVEMDTSPRTTGGIPRLPSQRALTELYEITKKFDSDMEIEGLRKDLKQITEEYEIFRKKPFGIADANTVVSGTSSLRQGSQATTKKRISFQSDSPPPSFDDRKDVRGAIVKRLTFFESTLKQYAAGKLQDEEGDNQSANHKDNAGAPKNIRFSMTASSPSERRMSDVTIDTDIKKVAIVAAKEDAKEQDKTKASNANDVVYLNDAGKSEQSDVSLANSYDSADVRQEKKFGQRLWNVMQAMKDWVRRRVEAFVASFAPKEKMIVTQMG